MLFGIPTEELLILAGVLLVGGITTGFLSGLLGVGGGAVIVPVLYQLFAAIGVPEEIRMHLCVGTSLAVIIPTSIRAFQHHRRRGSVDMQALRIWALPVLVGVVIGSLVAAMVSSAALKGVFGVFAILLGLRFIIGLRVTGEPKPLPGRALMSVMGTGIGLMSSLMGIGGGAVGNMIFALYNRPIHQGVGTASGLGVLISIPGAIGFIIAGWPEMDLLPPLSLGYVSVLGALLIAPVSILVAPLGVRVAHGFTRRKLEITLGLFLSLMGLRFLIDLALS